MEVYLERRQKCTPSRSGGAWSQETTSPHQTVRIRTARPFLDAGAVAHELVCVNHIFWSTSYPRVIEQTMRLAAYCASARVFTGGTRGKSSASTHFHNKALLRPHVKVPCPPPGNPYKHRLLFREAGGSSYVRDMLLTRPTNSNTSESGASSFKCRRAFDLPLEKTNFRGRSAQQSLQSVLILQGWRSTRFLLFGYEREELLHGRQVGGRIGKVEALSGHDPSDAPSSFSAFKRASTPLSLSART